MKNTSVETTWYPIVDSTSSQLIAESDQPFRVTVAYGPGDVEQVQSLHDGVMHFVAVDVPATAKVEVQK
jgi:hypothetical protein